jgi:hypothetical protein
VRSRAAGSCRKAKQALLTEGVQGLQKLKKKGKGVTKAIIEERDKQVWGWVRGALPRPARVPCLQLCGAHRAAILHTVWMSCLPCRCRS